MNIILISEKKNKTINFHIKLWFIIIAAVILILIVASFIYGVTNFAIDRGDQNRLMQLQQENKIVQQEITRIEYEISTLYSLMDSVKSPDGKLQPYGGESTSDSTMVHVSAQLNENMPDFNQVLDDLLLRTHAQKANYDELITHLEEKSYLKDRIPSIIPVQGWLIRGFGYHVDPFTNTTKMHEGLDIAAPAGTPIVAPADGRVTFAGTRKGFGVTVVIDHGYGYTTRYAHCQRTRVRTGMMVKRGDIIAYVGSTGQCSGPHLHYEVRIADRPVNPSNYILTFSASSD